MYLFKKVNRKKVSLLLSAVMLSGVMLTTSLIRAEAADFMHGHTSACYTTGMGNCNAQHKQSTRTEGSTAHCSNCGTSTPHTMYVNWDHCYGVGADYELGGKRNCNVCGATTYQWGGNSSWNHQIPQQVLSCGKSTTATGSLWFQNNTSEWTKGSVVLEAGVDIFSSELVLHSEPFSWDNQQSWTVENSKEITENGTYTVYAKGADGTIVAETITVDNIDHTGPSLSGVDKSESGWTNQDVVLTFHGQDMQPEGSTGSGLAAQAYSFDGGTTYTEENSLTVSKNGIYEVLMMDQLGNVGSGQVEVSNIDKNAPEIAGVLPLEEGWQAESVTMQIRAADADDGSGLHNEAYSVDGGMTWQSTPEFSIVENGAYQIQVRDLVGNVSMQDFDVNQIDMTAPVIEELQVTQDKIFENKVYVTIYAKDIQPDGSEGSGLHNEAYSMDGGETWQEENGFWVEKGKIYDLRVRDALEWESEEYVVEREKLPYPPIKDVPNNSAQSSNTPVVIPEKPEEEAPVETEKTEEQPEKEEHNVQEGSRPGDCAGMYDYGNWFAHRDNEFVDGMETSGADVDEESKNILLETQMSNKENPVQIINLPWYTTPIGKTVIVSAGILVSGIIIGGLFGLCIFSVPVYCVEERNRLYRLGRVLLHRTKEGYAVYLSNLMLRTATVPKYRIKVSRILLKKVENARLLVESEEKNLEVLMQETIDFEL